MSTEKKQKILFTIAYPLYGTGSGTDTRNVMDAAKKSGYEVSVLCADNNTTYDKDPEMKYYTVPFKSLAEGAEEIPGQCDFPYIMFTSHPNAKTLNYFTPEASLDIMLEYNSAFEKKLKEAISETKPDLINAQHDWLLSAQAARTGIPMVLKIHGTDLMGYEQSIELSEKIRESIAKNPDKDLRDKAEEILAKSSGAKEICTRLNGLIEENSGNENAIALLNQYKELTKYKLYISESKYAAEHADEVVVISEDQKKRFNRLFPKEAGKVNLIGNGYSTEVFHVEETRKEDVLPKLTSANTPDGKIPMDYDCMFLFVGKFADFKGIDSLLLANKIYDERLKAKGMKPLTILVGSGQKEEALKKETIDLELDNTHFVGRQGHDIIRPLQNSCTTSVASSRGEPFGLVILEGIGCGHSVVAFFSGGMPDILNLDKKEMDENTKHIVSKIGVLVKPLPEAPKGLTKEQAEDLNSCAYTYFIEKEEDRPEILASLAKRFNTSEEELQDFMNKYWESTEALADAMVKVATKEYEFDGAEIAKYAEENYSQEVVNEKTVKVYDSAIEKHKKKAMSRDD